MLNFAYFRINQLALFLSFSLPSVLFLFYCYAVVNLLVRNLPSRQSRKTRFFTGYVGKAHNNPSQLALLGGLKWTRTPALTLIRRVL